MSQTSEESRERLGHLFGKLTVTYTDTTLTAEMDGFTEYFRRVSNIKQ